MPEEINSAEEQKKKKKSGPIRYEAIVPVLVLSLLTFLYFSYYFDQHLKKAIEYVATQANGAEVNVGDLDTSFLRGQFDLNDLEVTNKEKPSLNTLAIGNVHFQFLWDALLRMKFVVEDASITDIRIQSPRRSPGRVLPPEPAKPSKLAAIQQEVLGQVRNRYAGNMLGDALSLVEGGDVEAKIQEIRGALKSEARIKALTEEVATKRELWDKRITRLTDTKKLNEIERSIQEVQKEKNVAKQLQSVKRLSDLLKDVEEQYKEIEVAQRELKDELAAIQKLPTEIQSLVKEDVNSLKNRFSIPKLDFKNMAMDLFAARFAGYIADARKYQAIAKEYVPEKKEENEDIIPRPRAEGKTYDFPITAGYPLFWLKRAAISSKGTAESFSGNVAGELTNVTTSPKLVKKPVVLDVSGDFPAAKVLGLKAVLTVDHTKAVPHQSALINVNSFAVAEQLFVNDDNMKFGFLDANGSMNLTAELVENKLSMNWNSALRKPQFILEHKSKLAKEMLSNILTGIQVITINGDAKGTFQNLKMNIASNLGTELAQGLTKEIGAKVAAAQDQINNLVQERINGPKDQLLGQIRSLGQNVNQLGDLQKMYQKNEKDIKAEIAKLQKSGTGDLKERGKKLLKGFKL